MLVKAFGILRFQDTRYLLVQLQALRGNHLLIERLAEKGVGEAVTDQSHLRTFLQYRKSHGLLEGVDKYVLVDISNCLQRLQGKLPSDHRGQGKKLITLLAQQ